MDRAELLSTALDAVNARPKAYGPPERNFTRISRHWNVYLTGKYGAGSAPLLDAVDVAAMMALMKIARLEETPDHIDSWVDLAGYAACGAECSTECSTAERSEVVEATVIEHDGDEVALADAVERNFGDPGAPRFKVGDRVKILPSAAASLPHYLVGEEGAIVAREVDAWGVDVDGDICLPWLIDDDDLEPVTPRFKVGDKVIAKTLPGEYHRALGR